MHLTQPVRVSPSALRVIASELGASGPDLDRAAHANELTDAVAALSRDASADWASVRAAVAAGDETSRLAARLVESVADVAAVLRTAADGYDAADDRAAAHQPGPRWAGPQEW